MLDSVTGETARLLNSTREASSNDDTNNARHVNWPSHRFRDDTALSE
jgi:hypothetical protein